MSATPSALVPRDRTASAARTVLLVEAEPEQRLYWEIILRSLGFAVRRAGTCGEAARLLTDDVSIVACSSYLPDGCGLDFFSQLRARNELSLTYLILLTGSGEESVEALRAGANDCLQIGISYGEMRARLELAERVITLTHALDDKSGQLDEALGALQRELRAAAALQSALLPKRLTMQELCVRTLYCPVGALGGDMIGLSPVIGGRIAFGLIDVVGHGTASALVSCSLIREMIDRMSVLLYGDSERAMQGALIVMKELNRRYCEAGLPGMYFTALSGVLDVSSGELAYCQAGHPSLLEFEPSQGWRERITSGYPVGLLEDADYVLERIQLEPGQMILAVSDGLLRPDEEDSAGMNKLLEGLQRMPAEPERILDGLQRHAAAISGPERDDQSALLLGRISQPQ